MNYLTPEEAAEKLKVKPEAIRRQLREGELRGRKVGNLWRIREQDLDLTPVSLREAVCIAVVLRRYSFKAPIFLMPFELAWSAIPTPLQDEAEKIVDKAGPLFETRDSPVGVYWKGPEAGSTKDVIMRMEQDDDSWLEELMELYEQGELGNAAKAEEEKQTALVLGEVLEEVLTDKLGLSEEEAHEKVRSLLAEGGLTKIKEHFKHLVEKEGGCENDG